MQRMTIRVSAKTAEITKSAVLTTGSQGIMIGVEFSPEWNGLAKTAQFYDGEHLIPVLMMSDFVLLPWEMCSIEGSRPAIVFIGKNADGVQVTPTVECSLGVVWYGIRDGLYPSEPPTPDWVTQIETAITKNIEAIKAANEAIALLDAGKLDKAPIPMAEPGDTQPVRRTEDGRLVTAPTGGGDVSQEYVDEQDAATLAAANRHTDSAVASISKYKLPAATRTELGGIKADKAQTGDTKGVYIGDDQMLHVAPDVLVVQATKEGGSWVADVGSESIRSFGGSAILKADVDGVSYVYRYQRYSTAGAYTGAVFDNPNIAKDAIERIEVVVDRAAKVHIVRTAYTPPIQTAYAVCYDDAAPPQSTANTWYIPKTMPKPEATAGLMLDVRWVHGHVGGLGYDVRLIWGAPGGADNVVIADKASVTTGITGEYSIPTEGTVRYQFVSADGRKHWQYVSGKLLPRQYSTGAAADAADKPVHGLELAYLPGMDIYVQMDKGNTADTMRLVPDDGATLPVYGNGIGTKTGTVPAGYILHLTNAGDHWQIINTPTTESKWEIIEDVTTKVDAKFERLREPDGTPYKFRAFRVSFKVGGEKEEPSFGLRFEFGSLADAKVMFAYASYNKNLRYLYAFCKPNNGFWEVNTAHPTGTDSRPAVIDSTAIGYLREAETSRPLYYFGTSDVIPANTHILIEGVRM